MTIQIKEIEPDSLYELRGYLRAVSDFVQTGELKWYFDALMFSYEGKVVSVKQLIKEAYINANLDNAELNVISAWSMIDTLTDEVCQFMPSAESSLSYRLLGINSGMWEFLSKTINTEQSTVYEYSDSHKPDGLLGISMSKIAFIIHNEASGRFLVFLGSVDA